jgi:lipopolysaccharide heptosyltransferase II
MGGHVEMTSWGRARRILCVRLDSIGDVLMTTPALAALKALPGKPHLVLLTSSASAALTGHLPMVDEVWSYDAPWVKQTAPTASACHDLAWIEKLRKGGFDAAIIFTVYTQSALPAAMMCWLANIPLRLAHCRENPYELLTERIAEAEPHSLQRHEVQRQLDLVKTIGACAAETRLTFRLHAHHQSAMRSRLRGALGDRFAGTGVGRWLVVHPGASAPSRRWPAERFGAAAAELAPHFDGIAVTGGSAEAELVMKVCAKIGSRALPLCGVLSLGELGALIASADLLISNNSGPVHLAAALGTPVVDLYALTNPQHTPWQVRSRVLNADVPCKFCYQSVCPQHHHHCLNGVMPEDVVAASLSLLCETRPDGDSPSRHFSPSPEARANLTIFART